MDSKKYLQLNNIDAYKIAFNLSNYVWDIVARWDYFSKDTVGKQFVRAIDSISANIAEGFGRYTKKDKIKFYWYSYGSVYWYSYGSVKESLDWNEKSRIRQLLSKEQYDCIFNELDNLPRMIHQLIQYTNHKLQQ